MVLFNLNLNQSHTQKKFLFQIFILITMTSNLKPPKCFSVSLYQVSIFCCGYDNDQSLETPRINNYSVTAASDQILLGDYNTG